MGFLSKPPKPLQSSQHDIQRPRSPSSLEIRNKATTPEDKVTTDHAETLSPQASGFRSKFKVSRSGDGDTALALFSNPGELQEVLDPKEQQRLQRKIDLMILPYLAVCYAFFYIDKTTLSYAAIFGIQEDLNLVGTQYSWYALFAPSVSLVSISWN